MRELLQGDDAMMDWIAVPDFLAAYKMSAMTDLPKPDHARNMRLVGHSRSGRPARRRADHGASRPRLYRPHVLQGLHDHRRARRQKSARGQLRRRAARYLEHPSADPRRPAARHQRQGHVRGRRVRRREGLLQGPARQGRRHRGGQAASRARLDRGARGLRHLEAREPRRIGFMPVEGGGIHRIWYTGGAGPMRRRCSTASPTTSS